MIVFQRKYWFGPQFFKLAFDGDINNSFDSQRYYLKHRHIVHSMKLDETKYPSNTE